jgi:NAD(P)-dependent dehydrogenase (short-subunit alcohol dehydrogenase family)
VTSVSCVIELGPQHQTNQENTMTDISGKTTIVVGASRGLGRGIATAFAHAGGTVVAVARSAPALAELTIEVSNVRTEVADARDGTVAATLLGRYQPQNVIVVAGASPRLAPLHEQTWESFSENWDADVRITFNWLREALRKPLRIGSRVVVISSGAALQGSSIAGGYSGAKTTQRFITAFAQEEADRASLGLTFTSVLPRLTPLTDLGRPSVQAHAARNGQSEQEYIERMGELLTPQAAGAAVLEVVRTDPASLAPAYMLTGAGLQKLP